MRAKEPKSVRLGLSSLTADRIRDYGPDSCDVCLKPTNLLVEFEATQYEHGNCCTECAPRLLVDVANATSWNVGVAKEYRNRNVR
jgi:hypothetical protein